MKTVCKVIGEESPRILKPIVFIKHLEFGLPEPGDYCPAHVEPTVYSPCGYEVVELIQRGGICDIMFAYNGDRSNGMIFLGHWNDGIVEPESE